MAVTGCAQLDCLRQRSDPELVRALERRRQTSLIVALGARRSRVVREPLIESLLLSIAGGAAGLVIAFAGTRVILQVVFPSLPGAGGVPIDVWPAAPVLLFAFAVSLATGLAFGIAPAWMATRADPMDALRGTGRSTARTGSLPQTVLIVFQAAVSLVLLSAAGLLTVALYGLENQAFGFEQDDRLIAQFSPRLAGYRPDQLTPLYDRIRGTISRVPGVSGVALCIYSPFGNNFWGTNIWVDGHAAPGPNDDTFTAWNRVTPDYFEVIGTAIVRGRGISGQDTATSRHVAVVSEAFARKFFKGAGSPWEALRPTWHWIGAGIRDRRRGKGRALLFEPISASRLVRSFSRPKRSTISRPRRRQPTRTPDRISCTTLSLPRRPAFICRRGRSTRPSRWSIPRCP